MEEGYNSNAGRQLDCFPDVNEINAYTKGVPSLGSHRMSFQNYCNNVEPLVRPATASGWDAIHKVEILEQRRRQTISPPTIVRHGHEQSTNPFIMTGQCGVPPSSLFDDDPRPLYTDPSSVRTTRDSLQKFSDEPNKDISVNGPSPIVRKQIYPNKRSANHLSPTSPHGTDSSSPSEFERVLLEEHRLSQNRRLSPLYNTIHSPQIHIASSISTSFDQPPPTRVWLTPPPPPPPPLYIHCPLTRPKEEI